MGFARNAAIVSQITDTAFRLDVVAHDPAVVKAWKQMLTDGKQFARSSGDFATETNAAWHRSRG